SVTPKMPAFCMTNARAASSGVPEYGCDAKSYITSGEPPKSFQRVVMFGEFTDVLKFSRAASCADVACRAFGKFTELFKSKLGAGRLNSSFATSDAPGAALPVSNGSEIVAPRIVAAAVSKIANRKMLFVLIVLLVTFIVPPSFSSRARSNRTRTSAARCKQRAISNELPCQCRSGDCRRGLESRSGNSNELSGSDLTDFSGKGFEQTFINCDLNVAAERTRYLGVVAQCDTVRRDDRVCQSACLSVVTECFHQRNGNFKPVY